MNHFHFHEDFYRHENRIIMVCRVVEKAGGGGAKTRNSIRGGRSVEGWRGGADSSLGCRGSKLLMRL